jgi:hypothetical protein
LVGPFLISMAAILAIAAKFDVSAHGLKYGDYQTDRNRQRVPPILRMISKVISLARTLSMLLAIMGTLFMRTIRCELPYSYCQDVLELITRLDDYESVHKGTHAFLTLIAEYAAIFTDPGLSVQERIERVGFVTGFIRGWRSWIVRSKLDQQRHFLTRETAVDVEISLAAVLNLYGIVSDLKISNLEPALRKMVRRHDTCVKNFDVLSVFPCSCC